MHVQDIHVKDIHVMIFNAHAVLPLPSYFSVTQDEMEKWFGIYKGHSPRS